MKFTPDTLKKVLLQIEERLKFSKEDINCPQGFDIEYSIKVDDIINSIGVNQSEEIRYCLAVLRELEYIYIASGEIKRVMPQGYKCICDVLRGINFKY